MLSNSTRSLILSAIFWSLGAFPLNAQKLEPTSINLTAQDGLAGNNVYYALQDTEGYIWFATETGVSRYNGRTFQNFYMEDGLGDNEIFRMDQDSKGRIWFSTFNTRLSYYLDGRLYNPGNTEFLRPKLGSYYAVFHESRDGTLFFATRYEVLAIDNKGEATKLLERKDGYPGTFGFEEENGEVWALTGSYENRYQLTLEGKVLNEPIREPLSEDLSDYIGFLARTQNNLSQNTYSLIQKYAAIRFGKRVAKSGINKSHGYGDGKLWFCTYDGVYRYDLSTDTNEYFFKNKIVTHVLKDNSGGLWFTTLGDGVFYVPSLENTSVRPFGNESNSDYASALGRIKEKVWFGGAYGRVGYFDGDVLVQPKDSEIRTNRSMVKGFEEAGDNDFFLASEDYLMYFKGDKLIDQIKIPIKVLRKIPDLGYAMGLSEGLMITTKEDMLSFVKRGLTRGMNSDDQLGTYPNSRIYDDLGFVIDIEPFGDGFLYGTAQGLRYMNKLIELQQLPENEILHERINDIFVLSDSSFVIASHGRGIHLYQNGKWRKVSRKDGLSSDICKKVISVKENELWVATTSGINQVVLEQEAIKVKKLTRPDGLISEEVYDLLIDENRLIAATSEGLSIIDIATLHSDNTPPSVDIKGLQVNGQHYSDDEVSLPSNPKNVAIEFDGIHFASLERLRFEYQLLGQDDEWKTTASTAVNFGNLSPGEYNFRLRAVNAFGSKSDIVERSFTVNLPFWRSWWFILSSILLFISIVFWFNQFTIRRNKLKSQRELDIQLRIADAERKALQSQLNPHFIFNSLNSIQSMVLKKQPEEAYAYLEKFSKLIRRVLKFSDLSMVTVNEELETLKLYMDMEKVRLENKFEYQINVGPTIGSNEAIPAMVIQPYVENAIWHGIMPLDGSRMGEILINISKNTDGIVIQVVDNGVGRDSTESEPGFGTKLADTLAKNFLGPDAGFVDVEDLMDQGVSAGTRVNINILTSALV